jgi:hypothetical protein
LQFADSRRQPRPSALTTTTIGALARLRQQTIPALIDAPNFRVRAQAVAAPAPWLTRAQEALAANALLAAIIASLLVVLATALPGWLVFSGTQSSASVLTYHSSAGVTGTAGSHVSDLGVTTFVGHVPFVQQLRYYNSVTSTGSEPMRFVEGARQASLAEYLQSVGVAVTLPYLNDAVATSQAIDTWEVAAARAQEASIAAPALEVWQVPQIAGGTVLPSTVTFYSCIGNGFCGTMANGQQVFTGAAACSYDLPYGTRFVLNGDPSGRVFVCLDRGALSPTWVDVWFYDAADGWAWQSMVGTSGSITVVE